MSGSGLYGYEGNVTVSANNLTTLYNVQPGNVTVANVPDRNFTTLYTNQSDIEPTRPYGNSNVEAFLNSGTDGSNTVQNIHMSGNLYVGNQSFLGNVGNVHITGGNTGYYLQTDGLGNLIWTDLTDGNSSGINYTHFDVTVTSNNQSFTNGELSKFASANLMNVFKNGVNLEPSQYTKTSANTIQINIPLQSGDTIDVLADVSGIGGGAPGGVTHSVQFNSGYTFEGTSSFTYDPDTDVVSMTNLNVATSNLGDVGNITISGGSNGYLLTTDGLGNLSWTVSSVNNATYAQIVTTGVQSNITTVGVLQGLSVSGNLDVAGNINVTGNLNYSNVTDLVVGDPLIYIGANNTGNLVDLGLVASYNDGTYYHTGIARNHSNGAWTFFDQVVAEPTTEIDFANGTIATVIGNFVGNGYGLTNIQSTNVTGLGNIATINLDGNVSNVLAGDGSWVAQTGGGGGTPGGANTYIQYNDNGSFNGDGNLTYNNTNQLLTVKNLLLNTQATENFVFDGLFSDPIYFDAKNQSIIYYYTGISVNTSLYIRGDNSTTYESISNNYESRTIVVILTQSNNAYINNIYIDGALQTVYWVNNPSSVTLTVPSLQSYTLTILKTYSGTYTVLGSFTEYI